MRSKLSRRTVLQGAAAAASLALLRRASSQPLTAGEGKPLEEFSYDQVELRGVIQLAQRDNVTAVLTSLNEESLLKPFREMSGEQAPGVSLGGWYEWNPNYDHHHSPTGLAPGHSFGQWTSAMARLSSASKAGAGPPRTDLAEKAMRLNQQAAAAITPEFFARTRFAGYTFDKLACGLKDSHQLLDDPDAFHQLDSIADAAVQVLPGHAVGREVQWKLGSDISWMWDENYILPENLYLLSAMGAGPRYQKMAEAYLLDASYFEPLSRNVDVLGDNHAYSYVNSLCSTMQAYLTGGSQMHLEAGVNAFAMLQAQSFVTGGWGPEELLRKPGYDEVAKSLAATHNSFETPCGSYAHMKLTRYLLRATHDGQYGDSMERVFLNTVLGVLPLEPNGRSFYHSDYNDVAKRVYSTTIWPCCAGSFPQVVADYGINSYLRQPGKVWVNLYQPSVLRWKEGSSAIILEQTSSYPEQGTIHLALTASHPTPFELRLRIPAWAGTSTLQVNGKPIPVSPTKGFASITRTWRTGDTIELTLAMPLRLETLAANGGPVHTDRAALLYGPLVLFPIRNPGETGPLAISREALLAAERTGPREWTAKTPAGPRVMVPFTEIGERSYTTYVKLTASA